jgi:hypothetical protein
LQGSELTPSTYKPSSGLECSWAPGDSYVRDLGLYSCVLDNPAAREEDLGMLNFLRVGGPIVDVFAAVVRIGRIQMDFTNADKSTFRQRQGEHGTEYKLSFQVVIEFGSNTGVLNCFCVSDGRRIGETTISFTELTS